LAERPDNAQPTAPVHASSRLEEAIEVPIPKDNSCLFNSIAYIYLWMDYKGFIHSGDFRKDYKL
jgi:hypothetical protein